MPSLSNDSVCDVLASIEHMLVASKVPFSAIRSIETKAGTAFVVEAKGAKMALEGKPVVSLRSGRRLRVPIRFEAPEEIELLVGRGRPKKNRILLPQLGGDHIWHRNLRGYGTCGFSASRVSMRNHTGRIDVRNSAVSNNHVIALWDRGRRGQPIDVPSVDDFATLHGFLRVKRTPWPVDMALGQIRDTSTASFLAVRGIGVIQGVREARRGETVRKSGARSGVTQSSIEGLATVRVNGVTFRNVWSIRPGLALPGDSGSAVLDNMSRIVGFVFAAVRRPQNDSSPRRSFVLGVVRKLPPKFVRIRLPDRGWISLPRADSRFLLSIS